MWLAIEGVIGAGKTTTSELVGRLASLTTALERSEEHPFLEAYYRDPVRYAVETELAFMLIQIRQLRELEAQESRITDFAPAKNLIFARLQASSADLRFLEVADAYLWRDLPQPDLTVFLDVPVETCLQRISLRGRPYEQDLRATNLRRLRDGYLQALDSLGRRTVRLELGGGETPAEVAELVLRCADSH